MKVLAFGDAHLDWVTGGLERYDELSWALDQIRAHAVARKVDRVEFLGDWCDPDVDDALTHRAIARAVEFDRALDDEGIRVDWITGNHDVIEDGRGSHTLMAIAKAGGRVHAQPANQILQTSAGRVEFVWLPYAGRDLRYDPDRYVRELAASHRMGLKGGALVVCAHMTQLESSHAVGSETIDMPRGRDMHFPHAAIAELVAAGGYRAVVQLCGHFHQRSVGQVILPGSLARLTHGEESHEPGFIVFEV